MDTLEARFSRHRRQRRAVQWRVSFAHGHGAGAAERWFEWFAPVTAAPDVLARVHNGVLLLQPAAVRIHGPRVDGLKVLARVHKIPLAWGDDRMPRLAEGTLDLPAIEQRQRGRALPGVAVGLDIGGTGMKACALVEGRIVRRAHGRTWPAGSSGIDSLVRRARELVAEVAGPDPVGSLGIGFASPMGVGGHIVGLSTVMREKLGGTEALADLPSQISAGITAGPVACYNDLANLGRHLSGLGRRRLLRLQIGTSFGGCWIDADGTVNAVELGRLIVDGAPDARPHTYLPLSGAMKSYLSGYGISLTLSEVLGEEVGAWDAGYRLAELLSAGRPEGREVAEWVSTLMSGAIHEARTFLPGLREVEAGGSLLTGITGRRVRDGVRESLRGLSTPPSFDIASDPGYDGAVAAALAPLLDTPLRGLQRVDG